MDQENKNEEITFTKRNVLIVAGDFSNVGDKEDILEFIEWLNKFPFKRKVEVAGDHEVGLDENQKKSQKPIVVIYKILQQQLRDKFGEAHTRYFMVLDDFSQKQKMQKNFGNKFRKVQTHGPPVNHGDKVRFTGEEFGDEELLKKILQVKPMQLLKKKEYILQIVQFWMKNMNSP